MCTPRSKGREKGRIRSRDNAREARLQREKPNKYRSAHENEHCNWQACKKRTKSSRERERERERGTEEQKALEGFDSFIKHDAGGFACSQSACACVHGKRITSRLFVFNSITLKKLAECLRFGILRSELVSLDQILHVERT